MRTLTALILAGLASVALAQSHPVLFEENFENGADRWKPTDPNAWKVEKVDGSNVYHQHKQSDYKPAFRSPLNYSLAKDVVVSDFVLETKVKSTGSDKSNHRDMCLFFGHQGPNQYYYVHISKKSDDRAGQVFIVNNKERTKISDFAVDGVNWGDGWHKVKIVRDTKSGDINVFFDDMKIISAKDTTFAWGQIGLGTFDDTGMYDDVKISGVPYKK